MNRKNLSRLAAVQLVTFACDQGFTKYGLSMSWFELGVFPDGTSDDDMENSPHWRRSHYNQMEREGPVCIKGPIAEPAQDGTSHLKTNDCIVVRVCAKHRGWQNYALKGELRFWRWFEPVKKIVASHIVR
jgi:hypothetical protein